MKKSNSLCIIVIALLLLQSAKSTAQANCKAISTKIDHLFAHYNAHTPGVAIALIQNGKVIFKKGYGSAHLEFNVPVTPKTVFHVASVSKQFTAFAIYLLAEQGKVSLDDDIRKYIPTVPDYGKTITLRQLCSHTSGLRDQWALVTLAGWRMDDVITTEQVLKLVSQQKNLNFPPGQQFSYSNTGFTLLAEVIARVTGKTFAEYTKENIFEPLGMTSTQFCDDYEKIVPLRAQSYEKVQGVYKHQVISYKNVGPTSLLTNVEDLSKWANNFQNPKVGTPKLIAEFNQVAYLNNGKPALYAMMNNQPLYHAKGQFVAKYRDAEVYMHGGHDGGFRTHLARFPKQGLTIITLSNDEHYKILSTNFKIVDLVLGRSHIKPQIRRTGTQTVQSPNKKVINSLANYQGKYYSKELDTYYKIGEQNGQLVMGHRRLSDIKLTSQAKDQFSGRISFPVTIQFIRNNAKQVTGFKVSNFGVKNLEFRKVGREK